MNLIARLSKLHKFLIKKGKCNNSHIKITETSASVSQHGASILRHVCRLSNTIKPSASSTEQMFFDGYYIILTSQKLDQRNGKIYDELRETILVTDESVLQRLVDILEQKAIAAIEKEEQQQEQLRKMNKLNSILDIL